MTESEYQGTTLQVDEVITLFLSIMTFSTPQVVYIEVLSNFGLRQLYLLPLFNTYEDELQSQRQSVQLRRRC